MVFEDEVAYRLERRGSLHAAQQPPAPSTSSLTTVGMSVAWQATRRESRPEPVSTERSLPLSLQRGDA